MKPVHDKLLSDIKKEWEVIADLRHKQILSGKDISYHFVIFPCIVELSASCDLTSVIDVGCGSGTLAKEIAQRCGKFVGVDMCARNIELASELCASLTNVLFINALIEDFASQSAPPSFTLAIANMTLMTCINLHSVLQAISRLV